MERKSQKGLIFNIQRFSLHDGPGIRTTVFMKGCPLRCQWCSNPESISPFPEIMTYDEKCIGCHKCLEVCSESAIFSGEKSREIDWLKCTQCLKCADVCPSGGIKRIGHYMSMEEILTQVRSDQMFYQNSSGGATVSGGEPLLQWEFVKELLSQCHEQGFHTVLDTCGYASCEQLEAVLDYVDLTLYDIKHMDTWKHKEGTGVGNELILLNAERTASRVRTWLRIPLLPGYNDSDANIIKLGEFALKLKAEKVSILPYHEWGISKYPRLGKSYFMEGSSPPGEESQQRAKEILESLEISATIGR